MDEAKKAELDQLTAYLRDVLPAHWRGLYEGCVAQGFSDADAMRLVMAYIVQNGGLRP